MNPTQKTLLANGFPNRHVLECWNNAETYKLHRSTLVIVKTISNAFGEGSIIAMIGGRNRGKTTIATYLGIEAIVQKRTAAYISAIGFFMTIRSTYGRRDGDTELDIMNSYRAPDFLVIDDLDKRAEKPYEQQLLYHLLDSRYGDMKDTLLLANANKEALEESLGPSICSRIDRTGGLIECQWEPFKPFVTKELTDGKE